MDIGTGVQGVRFANLNDGWAFGAEVWATHDGGAHWIKQSLPGLGGDPLVDDLEAAGESVYAVGAGGNGGFIIDSSPIHADAWHASPTSLALGAGPVPRASIVLQGSLGWILQNDRTVVNGARLADGGWLPWKPPCLDAGGPATLAAASGSLVAVCDEGIWTGPPMGVHGYVSSDGGNTYRQLGRLVPSHGVDGVATPQSSEIVVGGNTGSASALFATFDGGSTWHTVYQAGLNDEWTDLGFTTPTQGVAIYGATDLSAGTLLMTHDGGHTWHPVALPAL